MGRERMALKLVVRDGKSGEAISGVKILVRKCKDGEVVVRRLTAKNGKRGGVYVQNLADGRYWVDLEKSGYESVGVEVFVNTGELRKVAVEMWKKDGHTPDY